MTWWEILLIVLGAIAVILVVLFFVGRRMQAKQGEAAEQIEAMKQVTSMLIIDKKMMKVTESGLPQMAIDQVPKYLRWRKMPIVKAKLGTAYGAKVMTLVAEQEVFDVLPVKKEVKVEISGIYITAIKSVRGGSVEMTKSQKKAAEKAKKEKAKKQ